MDNVIPISQQSVTPEMVMQDVLKVSPDLAAIYVVGLPINGGSPMTWIAGSPLDAALAALVLQDVALAEMEGRLKVSRPQPPPTSRA